MTWKLQKARLEYQPKMPHVLFDFENLLFHEESVAHPEELNNIFPHIIGKPFLRLSRNSVYMKHDPLKVGVVFSGGQAAGGHNVISGLLDALQIMNRDSAIYGFLNGPIGIMENNVILINSQKIESYRNQGGFDLIGSGRDKIETPEQFQAAAKTVQELDLDGLVIIGGDDSNTNAAFLAEYFVANKIKTKVIGVPKTIDGDLMNEYIEIPFGFDTATKTYSEIIGSILRDSLSAKKYYFFIKIMGRSASHIALECAMQTHPNMTLVGEEIAAKKMSFQDITNQICDMIEARAKIDKNYGVIIIPEGVIEFIPEFQMLILELNRGTNLSPEAKACLESLPKDIQKQITMDRDPHGNVKVSKIETERLFIDAVEMELHRRKAKPISAQPLFLGYEGRSCLPSNFDCGYCYVLGHVAAILIDRGFTGYMACVNELQRDSDIWKMSGIPLTTMIHLEERKGKQKAVIRKTLVDLDREMFIEFKKHRKHWEIHDEYLYPGPIQFFGPSEITDSVPITIKMLR